LQARVAANALELARNGLPKPPFYLTGQVGGQPFSVHAEGERVIRRGHPRAAPADPATPRTPAPAGRLPRLSRLLALALRFDQLIRAGVVADYATLARVGHVSRARISQIMNLLVLAPDIQEQLLFLPRTQRGRDPLHLRRPPSGAIPPLCSAAG